MGPENQELNFEGIERQPLGTFTEIGRAHV